MGTKAEGFRGFRGEVALVTGAAGFIGSHLIDALLGAGAVVRGLDNFATGRRENLPTGAERFELVEADIRDAGACRDACRGAAFVFHQAALGSVPRSLSDPASTIAVNVAGTANVFSAARDARVRRVVYASSSSVYGDGARLPKKEGEEGLPLSPYALSKAMNEELAEAFGRLFGLALVGLRYFNVYGPRQDPEGPYAAVIPRFFQAYRSGEAPVIYGDGGQTRDFTFVGDAVAANLLAALAGPESCGRVFNVAGGGAVSVNDLAGKIRVLSGGGAEPHHETARPGDVRHSTADLARSAAGLGYAARVSLEEGLASTREHFESRIPAAGAEGRREKAV